MNNLTDKQQAKFNLIEYLRGLLKKGLDLTTSMARVVHGIPHRVDRLKGLGNAVVPQLVHTLFEIIKQVDNDVR